jgi:hypothetical protein
VSSFALAALHPAHVPVAAAGVDAVVRVRAAGVGEDGVDVALRLWTPIGVHVGVLRELSPASADLLGRAIALDERTLQYPAGRWTDGAREYELALALPPRANGDEMLAARIGVVVAGRVEGQAPIAVSWTRDERLLASARVTSSESTRGSQELPTGPSPQPRHTSAGEQVAAARCSGCGLEPQDGDRYCEACGRELGAAPG